jgi:hypothetical protein
MIAALLLVMAVAEPQPAPRLQAVATARIVAGERIRLDADAPPPSARLSRKVLRPATPGAPSSELRLIEFQ